MENIVYLLGAGFSAPLGLPVMANFISRSNDLFKADDRTYSIFVQVFKLIRELSYCNTYYNADLHNIEEVLSILEMRSDVHGNSERRMFTDYIGHVIKGFTPQITDPYKAEWRDRLFNEGTHGRNHNGWALYFGFVSSLFSLSYQFPADHDPKNGKCVALSPKVRYSIISLNYDVVLESVCSWLKKEFFLPDPVGFDRTFDPVSGVGQQIQMAKLHGSIDDPESIIAPTWNKTLPEKLRKSWQMAHICLSEANQIRILGYSLPISDAYIKYLLKSAVAFDPTSNLKQIDIICMDNGDVEERYRQFISDRFRRFKSADIISYLRSAGYLDLVASGVGPERLRQFTTLEQYHEEFMSAQ